MTDGGFRRSLKRHIADVKNIVGNDQDRSKFSKYANLCLRDQASVSKNFFLLLRRSPRLMALRIIYFPTITRNGFCFHIRKIISRRFLPPPKNRDIHIVEFFCRFYLKQNHSYYKKRNIFFLFLNIRPMCKSGPPADGPNLHVLFYPGRRLAAPFCM